MRWTGLLLAVACSHTLPPPAPLAVPAENAVGPANLPDGGPDDAGTPSPDAGAPRADLISPMTLAGREAPAGLDWGEKGKEPAGALFKNVKPHERGDQRRTFGGTIRVTCRTCHRGDEHPADLGFSRDLPEPFTKMPPDQLARRAEQVFKDVRRLQ